jgi:hypothetical protein
MFWDDSLKLDDILRLLDGARLAAKFVAPRSWTASSSQKQIGQMS